MKRFHLWISLARLPLPEASSESARMRPSAEASGIVRNARRKLLPWKRVILMKKGYFLLCAICTAMPFSTIHLLSLALFSVPILEGRT